MPATTVQTKHEEQLLPVGTPVPDAAWWAEFGTAIKSGRHCIGLTFNTNDYVTPESSLPKPLIPHLNEHFKNEGYDLIVNYSLSSGIEIFDRDADKESKFRRYSGLSPEDPAGEGNSQQPPAAIVLQGLNQLLSQNTIRVLVILNYAHHMAPAMQAGMATVASEDQISVIEILHAWSLDNYLNTKTENVVVAILREGQFHELLAEHWKIIRIDLPTTDELGRFYAMLTNLSKTNKPFAALQDDLTIDEAARASVGLRLRTIEEMSRRCAVLGTPITLDGIKSEKSREIKQLCGDVLEVMETNITLDDLAGLDYIKAFYREIRDQVRKGHRGVPLGYLMGGPPGCGKSYQVRALANELGWSCLEMRTVRSMWVGESERNLERILNTIQSNLPAILFIDEVDQMLGQRGEGGDAGTSNRMLARLWQFMAQSELRGRLIIATATNRPSLLDPASVDRMAQYVIPVLLPTAEEFIAVIPNAAQQLGRTLEDGFDVDHAARLLQGKGLSIRQLLDLLAMAALKSDFAEAGSPISQAAFTDTARNFRNNHNPLEIEAITLEAIRMTSFANLLPWYGIEKTYPFPDYLRRLMNENYEVDPDALNKRLSELRQPGFNHGR